MLDENVRCWQVHCNVTPFLLPASADKQDGVCCFCTKKGDGVDPVCERPHIVMSFSNM